MDGKRWRAAGHPFLTSINLMKREVTVYPDYGLINFFKIVPKTIALPFNTQIAYRLAPSIAVLHRILGPARQLEEETKKFGRLPVIHRTFPGNTRISDFN